MSNRELYLTEKVIKFEEGLRLTPYYCTEGYPTIGYGEKIGTKNAPLLDITWTEEEAHTKLKLRLQSGVSELSKDKVVKPVWESLIEDEDRRVILLSMWYQLGIVGLTGFDNFFKALTNKDYKKASLEMLDSLAARQTPKRWKRQSTAMERGDVLSTYKF